MEKIRIATIIWKDGIGGAERSLVDIASSLNRDRFDMHFYYLSGDKGIFAEQIIDLGYNVEFLHWMNGYDFNGRIRLLLSLKQYCPHLVHDHIVPPLTREFVKILIRCPVINTEHGNALLSLDYIAPFKKFINRLGYFFCDHVISNSHASSQALFLLYKLTDKVTVIHLGINIEKFIALPRIKNDTFTIGYVGRIENRHKGVDQLPHIANILKTKLEKKFQFLIAGDGNDKISTMTLCNDLGVSNYFSFLGFVDDINYFLNTVDVLVVPSRREPLGLVVIEALAKNLPVVAFDVDGISEILKNSPLGMLVKPGDLDGFANSVVSIANDSCDFVRSDSYISTNFSSIVMMANIEKIYDQFLLNGNSR